jgi:hypothetical protein
MSFFSFTKLENRKVEQVPLGVVGTSGKGEEVGKGKRRVNMVQIVCTYVYICKNDTF